LSDDHPTQRTTYKASHLSSGLRHFVMKNPQSSPYAQASVRCSRQTRAYLLARNLVIYSERMRV
jgi:hypothetical protein